MISTGQQLRLRIQDPFRYDSEELFGDGTASGFKLRQGAPYSHLSASATASVPVAAGWTATGATVDHAQGRVVFGAAISAHSAFQVDYAWSVFSEDELAYFTAEGGGVLGAALLAVQTLMFDAWKRARWASPDGSQYDDSKAMDNLVKLRSALRAEQVDDIGPQGGIESWSEEQAYYCWLFIHNSEKTPVVSTAIFGAAINAAC